MAEQVIEGAVESKKEATTESTQETRSNKLWDQSEHDRAIAEAVKAAESKYSDYDKLQQKLNELEAEREKAELAEKSELERKDHELTKLQKELEEKNNIAKQYELKELRSKVLSDKKYATLPSVYKNAISLSDNELEIQAEADKVLEQYQQDFGIVSQSFGKPTDRAVPAKEKGGVVKSIVDLKESLRSRMNSTR